MPAPLVGLSSSRFEIPGCWRAMRGMSLREVAIRAARTQRQLSFLEQGRVGRLVRDLAVALGSGVIA